MSEPSPERRPARSGFSFSQKIGPLPAWGWLAGAAVLGIGYVWWRNRQNANAAAATPTTTSSTAASNGQIDYAPQIATLQSEITNLQNGEAQNASATAGQGEAIQDINQGEAGEGKKPKPPVRKPPPPRKPAPKPPTQGSGNRGRGSGSQPAPRKPPPPRRRPAPRRTG